MRIEAVTVRNFRGLRRVEVGGLADASLVTVSGPNGSGKSLLFEAMTFAWRALLPWQSQWDLRPLVGPWNPTAEILLTFVLTETERRSLREFVTRLGVEMSESPPEQIRLEVHVTPDGQFGNRHVESSTEWANYLWAPAFAEAHPFANLDYLPADRGIQRGEQAQVNPAMLGAAQTEGLRQQVFNSFVQQRQILTLTGVQPFLASLDYLDMLSDREGRPRSGDFEAITGPFHEATGKTIHRPAIDPAAPFGATLSVETPSGARHGLDQLSSGEQEVLALMFYVRRLSASGGLLLVDEPELHLHPALQQSLFAVMENIAERAQVWIVTHSPKLVAAASLSAVLHMSPTDGTDRNQVTKASDEEARGQLLSDLGLHPIDVLQSDSLVVVEGEVDARRLPAALALTLSKASVLVAGNAAGVEATARTLHSSRPLVPWVAIRDRDLLSDVAVAEKQREVPGLFVWPSRTLENELLHPPLVVRTLTKAGRKCHEDEVRAHLKSMAGEQFETILAHLVDAELRARYPYQLGKHSTPLEQKHRFLEAQAESAKRKLSDLADVELNVRADLDARWARDWFKLMDGKRALAEYLQHTPYQSVSDFVSAVTHTMREEPEFMPPGLAALRDTIDRARDAQR